MSAKIKDDSLRYAPLVQPILLARALGVSQHGLEHTLDALGIAPHRPTPNAKRLLTFEQAEQVARAIR